MLKVKYMELCSILIKKIKMEGKKVFILESYLNMSVIFILSD